MAEVIIFGGTSEGRELAEYAALREIPTLLSVVSEYGKKLAGDREGLSVRCGALDEYGIASLLKREKPRLVLDVTHPHAVEATAQIKAACMRTGVRCLRVLRGQEEIPPAGEKANGRIFFVHTPQEAREILAFDEEPVLLTTGSKELAVFLENPQLRGRIFARVLPDSRVLAECERQGLGGQQLIAMQGPFSEELNCALIRSVKAGWLVTKESGSRGGYSEKLRAAAKCNIRTIVIQRPEQEAGISVEEARSELVRLSQKRELFLIGMGMGAGNQLTLEALEALGQSEAVLGAARMLEDVERWTKGKIREKIYLADEIARWIRRHPEYARIAVVYSGDTGFYSGCAPLLKKLERDQIQSGQREFQVHVLAGISTMSCLCSRLGRSWEEIRPASIHGRECDIKQLLLRSPKVFLLLGGEETLGRLCRRLVQENLGNVKVSAGIRLGYSDEKIVTGKAEELCGREEDSLAAVILERQTGEQEDE